MVKATQIELAALGHRLPADSPVRLWVEQGFNPGLAMNEASRLQPLRYMSFPRAEVPQGLQPSHFQALQCRPKGLLHLSGNDHLGRRDGSRSRRYRGFTMIELMIVISIILILISIAVPMYNQSIIRAREAVLKQNLFTMRTAINMYTEDKQKAPQSLEDLVQAGYLKMIPKDPITESRQTWTVDQEDLMQSVDQTQPGITDVHSGSAAVSTDGSAYSTW